MTTRRVRNNLLREGGALLTQGLLMGLNLLPSRHRPERARDIHTVVFLHGYMGARSTLFPLQGYLASQGYQRQLSFTYPSS
ncbi:MAG: hypothetical protein HN348_33495, partial [Proteobacteria bacterium]|nr:hypothetical protein [Pseudomonadota bacterium]